MKIRDYYYIEETESLLIEFSTIEDGDNYYRELFLSFWDVEYYSTDIIDKHTIKDITDEEVVELLNQYLIENELSEPQSL